ncbi:efflux RND transporter permease subunit [Planctomycetaceae bacterium SH139]
MDVIQISVEYRGASPEEVEEGICQRIEEAVRSVTGVYRITSVAREGAGNVMVELDSGRDEADVQEVLGEVRSRVYNIPSFPALAEQPVVQRQQPRTTALSIGVIGPDDDSVQASLALRELAEKVRDEVLLRDDVSQAEVVGVPDYQIDVEINEDVLRQYNLTLSQVAEVVRSENVEVPGGTLKTSSQDILLRGSNRQSTGSTIAAIPLIKDARGVVLTIGDLGEVRDEFTDDSAISRINGRPDLAVQIDSAKTEDIINVGDVVKEFVDNYDVPPG